LADHTTTNANRLKERRVQPARSWQKRSSGGQKLPQHLRHVIDIFLDQQVIGITQLIPHDWLYAVCLDAQVLRQNNRPELPAARQMLEVLIQVRHALIGQGRVNTRLISLVDPDFASGIFEQEDGLARLEDND